MYPSTRCSSKGPAGSLTAVHRERSVVAIVAGGTILACSSRPSRSVCREFDTPIVRARPSRCAVSSARYASRLPSVQSLRWKPLHGCGEGLAHQYVAP